MLTGNPLLVLIVAGVLAFLAIVQFWLATRHDHAVSIQGPLEEERAIFARIAEKRATLADIEHDLQKRREALAVVADVQVEVDALTRRRDNLLDEWNQMDERRNEVLGLRRELEEAQIDKLRFDAEMATAKAELEDIRDRLARAERLLDQVDSLKKEHDELAQRIDVLKPELRRLEEAQERGDRLVELARDLEADAARLEGQIAAAKAEAKELDAHIAAARNTAAEVAEERTRALSDLSAAEVALRSIRDEQKIIQDWLRQGQSDMERQQADLARARAAAIEAQGQLDNLQKFNRDLQEQNSELSVERARMVASADDLRREITHLEEVRATLEARNAMLSRQAAGVGGGGPGDDHLRELKVVPQVVSVLREWPASNIIDENEALHRVQLHFAATGLTYPDRTLWKVLPRRVSFLRVICAESARPEKKEVSCILCSKR